MTPIPQPSLFDLAAQAERDKTLEQTMRDEIVLLDQRIARAEAWLNSPITKDDPRRAKAEAEYWKIIEERDRKLCILENRQELRCCILQLPPTARYQPKGSDQVYEVLRILFHGEPTEPNEITLDGLAAYMKEIAWIKEIGRV